MGGANKENGAKKEEKNIFSRFRCRFRQFVGVCVRF
jgi:hypothetical protein